MECRDDPDEAHAFAKKMLTHHSEMKELYVATANSLPVLHSIRYEGRINTIRIVATDLFVELAVEIANSSVMAALYQRPFTQGRIAIQSLLRYLRDAVRPRG